MCIMPCASYIGCNSMHMHTCGLATCSLISPVENSMSSSSTSMAKGMLAAEHTLDVSSHVQNLSHSKDHSKVWERAKQPPSYCNVPEPPCRYRET